MPAAALSALRRRLCDCLKIAARPPVVISAVRADAPPTAADGRPATSLGFVREAAAAAAPPPRIAGGSRQMRLFFERVEAGLVRPDRAASSPALLAGASAWPGASESGSDMLPDLPPTRPARLTCPLSNVQVRVPAAQRRRQPACRRSAEHSAPQQVSPPAFCAPLQNVGVSLF